MTQTDTVEKFHNSVIQHGPLSNRIYLMKASGDDMPNLPDELCELAEEKGYGKIFAKAPASLADGFTEAGYITEATIPGFYRGEQAAVFLAKFLDSDRATSSCQSQLDEVLQLAKGRMSDKAATKAENAPTVRPCGPNDAPAMAKIYAEVFPTYPFPIYDPAYLLETMDTHVDYFGIERDGELIALASAEMDAGSLSVEMTDFATLPNCRQGGCASALLNTMEQAMKQKGFICSYTIARAVSPGMNITFAKNGYQYGGTLTNNTCISGQIESMNIWYRVL